MLLEERPKQVPGPPHANDEEDSVRAAQIRPGFLDDAAERLEGLSLRFEDRAHSAIEREAAEVGTPGNPHAFEAALERLRKQRRIGGIAAWIAGVGPGHHAQQKGRVAHRASHGPLHQESEKRHCGWGRGHEPNSGAQSNDVVEVARIAQGTTEVAAISKGEQTSGECRTGAAARSPRALCQVVWIDGRTVYLVVGVRAHSKLGHVRFADRERAGLPQSLDENRVLRRHVILVDRGAPCPWESRQLAPNL